MTLTVTHASSLGTFSAAEQRHSVLLDGEQASFADHGLKLLWLDPYWITHAGQPLAVLPTLERLAELRRADPDTLGHVVRELRPSVRDSITSRWPHLSPNLTTTFLTVAGPRQIARCHIDGELIALEAGEAGGFMCHPHGNDDQFFRRLATRVFSDLDAAPSIYSAIRVLARGFATAAIGSRFVSPVVEIGLGDGRYCSGVAATLATLPDREIAALLAPAPERVHLGVALPCLRTATAAMADSLTVA